MSMPLGQGAWDDLWEHAVQTVMAVRLPQATRTQVNRITQAMNIANANFPAALPGFGQWRPGDINTDPRARAIVEYMPAGFTGYRFVEFIAKAQTMNAPTTSQSERYAIYAWARGLRPNIDDAMEILSQAAPELYAQGVQQFGWPGSPQEIEAATDESRWQRTGAAGGAASAFSRLFGRSFDWIPGIGGDGDAAPWLKWTVYGGATVAAAYIASVIYRNLRGGS